MEALVGWLDPDETAELRAELEAAKAEIKHLTRSRDNFAANAENSLHHLDVARSEIVAKDAEIAALKTKPLHYEYETVVQMHYEWTQQLAARDLVIQKMRDALSKLDSISHMSCNSVQEALSIQPDTAALDEYVAQAVEQEREACAALCESLPRKFRSEFHSVAEECAGAIRARKP